MGGATYTLAHAPWLKSEANNQQVGPDSVNQTQQSFYLAPLKNFGTNYDAGLFSCAPGLTVKICVERLPIGF